MSFTDTVLTNAALSDPLELVLLHAVHLIILEFTQENRSYSRYLGFKDFNQICREAATKDLNLQHLGEGSSSPELTLKLLRHPRRDVDYLSTQYPPA